MNGILLTQNSTPIFKYIVWVLGKIMEGIFTVIDFIGLPNIGVAIILFTIVVNVMLLPMTIKQQKFSKLSAKMNPELNAIRAKYKDKKDNNSIMAQNQEIQEVYARYGVSPSGSCVHLLIQMPILFALYRVINAMPAYVGKIKATFSVLANAIIENDKAEFLMNSGRDTITNTIRTYGRALTSANGDIEKIENGIIDVLNRVSSTDMAFISEHYGLSELTYADQLILSNDTTRGLIDTYNNFLGLNIGDSPSSMINSALSIGAYGIVIGALMIPILSMVTQWINMKLMPQTNQNTTDPQAASMQKSMKTMNMFMPIMSAWFCFTLPAGMGFYWVAGSVVRSIIQVIVNKHLDKVDFNELIKKNQAKSAKKVEKMKVAQEKMNQYAAMNTRYIENKVNNSSMSAAEKEAAIKKAQEYYNKSSAQPGSMMSKANMVRQFNEKNNKGNE